MSVERVEQQILAGTLRTGKTYGFDEAHDPTRPAQMWFQSAPEGEVLFVVFYSQACRWSQCLGCNLPSKSSRRPVGYRPLMEQVDQLFRAPEVLARRAQIHKVILSNNGSMLDEATFSSTALIYLFARMNQHLPALSVVTLETRAEYVDLAELEFLARVLKEADTPRALELAIGFEAFDERIRNELFFKGLSLRVFEELVAKLAPYGFALKCYFMQKPVPGVSDAAGIADIEAAIDYLAEVGRRSGVKLNLHLNPTYVAAGTRLAESFARGEYVPPTLRDVARAARHARGKGLSLFLGLYDEGLAVPGGSFLRAGEEACVARLEEFNRTQDYALLDRVAEGDGGGAAE
ncbi:MAG: hypothetical protein HZA54_08145 [Planctomycetes bacterium]|nr:hypothetical protein [Planctomycetota bacterium]